MKSFRCTFIISFLFFAAGLHAAPARDSLMVMFWNLENLFDPHDDSTNENASEKEFSAAGRKHWSGSRFQTKCNAISKSIFWVAQEKGRLPDVIGVAEAEDRYVLWRLVNSTLLRKAGYEIVHYDSPDPRGIDVGLLYRSSRLELLSSRPLRVGSPSFRTRDILLACLGLMADGCIIDSVAVLVNHHPSKFGGAASSPKRQVAMSVLRHAADSLTELGYHNIIAMGDFNDTPDNPSFGILDGSLTNLGRALSEKGEGTIRFGGKWELIDMFMVSDSYRNGRMEVLHVPFLTAWDNTHSGDKPLRTYSGPKYNGGVSDHCPILLEIH